MIKLSKTISSKIDTLTMRVVKVFRLGKDDVQEATQVTPSGIDSAPIKDLIAVFAQTGDKGETVIIGYLNRKQIAAIGETRIYSTDENGNLKISIHLKNDGTAEVGGTGDNLVRYKPVEDAFKAIEDFLNQQLPLIATGISTGGGSYTPGIPSFAISSAKITALKTSEND